MNFAQAAIAAQKGGQNIAGATLGNMMGGNLAQMTNVPPQQANTLGQAQPVFNQGVQQAAQGIYGGVDQRQNSVGAAPLFKKCNKKY